MKLIPNTLNPSLPRPSIFRYRIYIDIQSDKHYYNIYSKNALALYRKLDTLVSSFYNLALTNHSTVCRPMQNLKVDAGYKLAELRWRDRKNSTTKSRFFPDATSAREALECPTRQDATEGSQAASQGRLQTPLQLSQEKKTQARECHTHRPPSTLRLTLQKR